MFRIAASTILVAVLTAKAASPALQMQGGGHQTFVFNSMNSVGTGGQPVYPWGFHYYEKDGPHDAPDYEDMVWDDMAVSCKPHALPYCWGGGNPIDRYCYIASYPTSIPACSDEYEQSSNSYSAVRSWTAPLSGTVVITTPSSNGNVRKTCCSQGFDSVIRIYRNDFMFFEKELEEGNTAGFSLNETIEVNDGDVLWFHNDPSPLSPPDSIVFLPYIQLTVGSGYDTDPIETSSSTDYDPDTQGVAGWTYETYDRVAEAYADMVPCQTTSSWVEDQGCGTSVCQIGATTQHPGPSLHAVRVWTAPQDGFVLLQSITHVRKPTSSGDPAAIQVLHVGAEPTILATETVTDDIGVPLGAAVHVRENERIELHVIPLTANPTGAGLIVDVSIESFPDGEQPLHPVSMTSGPNVMVQSGDSFWFYEHRKVFGNLILDSVPLRIHDSMVEIMNTYDTEFAYEFWAGADLTTVRTTIGGGAESGDPLHSNFNMWHEGDATWRSTDTVVQHTYAQAIFNLEDDDYVASLSGSGHVMGKQPDFIHVGRGASVELSHSAYGFRLMFPADPGSTYTLDLPVNETFTDTDIGAQFPMDEASDEWDLSLTDTIVPMWGIAPYDMAELEQNQTPHVIVLADVESCFAEMTGTDLTGVVNPKVGTILQYFDTFNVRWQPGQQPSQILHWAAYFDGSDTNVRLDGPSSIAELFATEGARVAYIGTSSTMKDAVTSATTLKSIDPNSRLFLKNCTLGTSAMGQIRAQDGGYIRIEEALLVGDISLEAVGGAANQPSTIEIVNLDTNGHSISCSTEGNGQILGFTCP